MYSHRIKLGILSRMNFRWANSWFGRWVARFACAPLGLSMKCSMSFSSVSIVVCFVKQTAFRFLLKLIFFFDFFFKVEFFILFYTIIYVHLELIKKIN